MFVSWGIKFKDATLLYALPNVVSNGCTYSPDSTNDLPPGTAYQFKSGEQPLYQNWNQHSRLTFSAYNFQPKTDFLFILSLSVGICTLASVQDISFV